MSIPIDKLYHYIEDVAKANCDDILIYRFYPHGSKNIKDLTCFRTYSRDLSSLTSPVIYCNDQEPLNFLMFVDGIKKNIPLDVADDFIIENNISAVHSYFWSIYDRIIVLHSEKRSTELDQFTDDLFVRVYYWSHAIISLDWFRYARYEKIKKKIINKTFLIYNRAWSGTREYRLKFIDLLISNNLINKCHTTFNPIEPELEIHYNNHTFVNSNFIPSHLLENHLPLNTAEASASADYEIDDYNSTEFEVVLETLFDDSRLHLTEKILRPIALGQPFLLAATHGSLAYLRSYGFRTFASVIDESYDTIEDPLLRLEAIVKAMKEIATWTEAERTEKLAIANRIAEYNRKHFFSNKFFNSVTDELTNNLDIAIDIVKSTNTGARFINEVNVLGQHPLHKNILYNYFTNDIVAAAAKTANEYYRRTLPKD